MPNESWKNVTPGGVGLNPGSTERISTGAWRNQRPVIELEKCTHCMICWIDCPDGSFQVTDQRIQGIDLEHCKGCGICADVCPTKCITMLPERQL